MTLQFLIPQYRETEETIKPLLDSIEIQQNIDKNKIGAIIVNDGSDVKLSRDFLNKYSYKIEYYEEEHRGVSATRNACLDHATADYVMFCDADDMFYNSCGLWIIFREIEKFNGFDSLVSVFMEEGRMPGTKEVFYIDHKMDSTFVHGKIHRRQFLIDNNIRWNNSLTVHEDSYFNCLCQNLAKELKHCPTPFYLWKWRDDSVCRGDREYIFKTYNNMLDSNTALVNEFLRRRMKDKAQFFCTNMIFDAYFSMNKKEWLEQKNQEYRLSVENRFREYYKEFKELFESTPDEIKNQIIAGQKNRMFNEGMFLEEITFNQWMKIIKNEE